MSGKPDGKHRDTKKSPQARHAAERKEEEGAKISEALTAAARLLVVRPVGRHGR